MNLTQLASVEALRKQLQNLQVTIARLLQITTSLPEGQVRNELIDEVSAFDFIADVIRQALDAILEME